MSDHFIETILCLSSKNFSNTGLKASQFISYLYAFLDVEFADNILLSFDSLMLF